MKTQNYQNHIRLIFWYHGVVLFSTLAVVIGSTVNVVKSAGDSERIYSASLICLISMILLCMIFFARGFALRAQDRAIRAEQNLRHYIMAGKALPSALTMGQIIALRFASDDEFIILGEKAVKENLKPDAIKKEIQNWQGDFHRV